MNKKLRFDLPSIPVFRIVDQFYCEKKGHLSLEHPEVNISSIILDDGTESHRILEDDTEPLSDEEIERLIDEDKEFILSEKSFMAEFEGITIGGRPDAIVFNGRNVELLIEFKFSPKQRPYNTHHIQSQTYGYILNKCGFETNDLFYGLVFFEQQFNLGDEKNYLELLDSEGLLSTISNKLMKGKKKPLKDKRYIGPIELDLCKCYLYPFRMDEAIRILSWASEYWLNKRGPMPTTNAKKCRICGYNAVGICNNALDFPLETIIVEKKELDGEINYNVILPK